MATITGRTARSTLPPCDTPGVATASLGSPDGLSRADAEAAWHAVTPPLAGTPHVRISKDGGRTYPVPQPRRAVAADGGEQAPVRAESHREDLAVVAGQGAQVPGRPVPGPSRTRSSRRATPK